MDQPCGSTTEQTSSQAKFEQNKSAAESTNHPSTSSMAHARNTNPGGSQNNPTTPSITKLPQLCSICGDSSENRHFGIDYISCEACTYFFERMVRMGNQLVCREDNNCTIDVENRNKCQCCRYQKCLTKGMKKEDIDEDRFNRVKQAPSEFALKQLSEFTLDAIIELEKSVEKKLTDPQFPITTFADLVAFVNSNPTPPAGKRPNTPPISHQYANCVKTLINSSKAVPYFSSLPKSDQRLLLTAAWDELLLQSLLYKPMDIEDVLLVSTGQLYTKDDETLSAMKNILETMLPELIILMQNMKIKRPEMGLIRASILYNSKVPDLKCAEKVELLYCKTNQIVNDYCRSVHRSESSLVLLRIASFRSLVKECLKLLYCFRKLDEDSIQIFLEKVLGSTEGDSSGCSF